MTQNERVNIIRKEAKLTMEKFGERLGVTKSSISNIEAGRHTLTDQMIKAICREFNVNEEWLRDGIGEMYIKDPGNALVELAREYGLNKNELSLVASFLELDESERAAVIKSMKAGVFRSQ